MTKKCNNKVRILLINYPLFSLTLKYSPFKVTNGNTSFHYYHLESSAHILGFLKVETTNLRSKFHHLERATLKYYHKL